MKSTVEKTQSQPTNGDSGLDAIHSQESQNGATVRPRAPQSRPEIAVLGWDVRSYRLALRQNKV